jgi:citrate synthase
MKPCLKAEAITVAPKSTSGSLADIRTEIATNDVRHIWVRNHDLTADVMGHRTFSEVIFLLITQRFPSDSERRMIDAMLVSLMEHGLTPSAMVARVTYGVAPESLQGAVAAGLLGAGSVVLGSMEDTGRLLTRIATEVADGSSQQDAIDRIVREYRAEHRHLPGMGHAIHTEGDPRAVRLFELAEQNGFEGEHVVALRALSAAVAAKKLLPVNVTGAVAAILLEMGIPWRLHRGFALISRSAGLIAHIGEELEHPITPALRGLVRRSGEVQA